MGETVVVIQIPKTGGTSLSQMLFDVFGVNEVQSDFDHFRRNLLGHVTIPDIERFFRSIPADLREKIRVLTGHVPYGLHWSTPGRFRYVTFLRNPIDRLLSGFAYGNAYQAKDKDWLRFALHFSISVGADIGFDNSLTRTLVGSEVLTPLESSTTWDLPMVTIEDRERAISNLSSFSFVGLTERFETSVGMLFDLLDKPVPTIRRFNKTGIRLHQNETPLQTLRLIERRHEHDIAVYAHACKLYNRRARLYGFRLAEPYVRQTTDEGPISSGDHNHLFSADEAFSSNPATAWLSWPYVIEKSGEFIGWEAMTAWTCRTVSIVTAIDETANFFVEGSDDGFRRDIRCVHQITVPSRAAAEIALPDHTVSAKAWRLKRVGDGASMIVPALRLNGLPLPSIDVDALQRSLSEARSRFCA